MSSRKVNSIDTGAIISGNDLRSGRTVYFTQTGAWSEVLKRALVIRDDADAATYLARASAHSDVVGAALIKTTEQGQPLHIRELIRALGPSITANATASSLSVGGSRVSV